jgi:hypothetical protein
MNHMDSLLRHKLTGEKMLTFLRILLLLLFVLLLGFGLGAGAIPATSLPLVLTVRKLLLARDALVAGSDYTHTQQMPKLHNPGKNH